MAKRQLSIFWGDTLVKCEPRKSIVGHLVKPIATIIAGKHIIKAKYKSGHFYFAGTRHFCFVLTAAGENVLKLVKRGLKIALLTN
jgi:hypothetical protein